MYRTSYILISTVLVLTALVALSCSDHFVKAVGPRSYSIDEVASFFPLDEGYQTTFVVTDSYGTSEIVIFTVGKEIPFQNGTATQWFKKSSNSFDTSYFVTTDHTLLFYERKNSTPEIILDLPLTPGKSWSRFSSSAIDGIINDFDILITDNKTIQDTSTTITGGATFKTFPTEGSLDMTVEKIESIELSTGDYFSGAARISNHGNNGSKNYYWFVPGVGLVKYVMGVTEPLNLSGNVEAELLSRGFVN